MAAFKTYAEPLPLPDLVVSQVRVNDGATDNQIVAGATMTVGYTVTNRGSGATLVKGWTETVWLTKDKDRPHPGLGDILLASYAYTRPDVLARNAGYDQTVTVTVPAGIEAGIWYVTPWVDPYDAALEDTLASNTNPDDPNQLD